MNSAILRVRPLHFGLRAMDPIFFPPAKAANIFRGAFGDIFRRIACVPDCRDAKSCLRASDCAYARMFEPRAGLRAPAGDNPSGFEDRPRPFVLRGASLDGQRFEIGERFTLAVNVFDPESPVLDYFRITFEQLCAEGLGPGRPRVELVDAVELPGVEIDLSPRSEPVNRIKVAFLTPTELKSGGEILREPRFDALFKRARDRVTGLISLYQQPDPLRQPDFRGMGDRAGAVRMIGGSFQQVERQRRSSRTGQRHSLGGFTGEAEYEGDLAEFLPYLEAAWWTGVGRLTVWGNGLVSAVAQSVDGSATCVPDSCGIQ